MGLGAGLYGIVTYNRAVKRFVLAGVLLGWLWLAGAASGASLVRVLPEDQNVSNASFLTAPPHDPEGRVFISTRGDGGEARIFVVRDGQRLPQPFLELDGVNSVFERGLLSFAFDPEYAVNGRFYVFYTGDGPDSIDPSGQEGDIRIVEFQRSAGDPNRADPNSARLVLRVRHSAGNHNGGWIGFGPDNRLYISIGENAEPDNSQDLGNLLGKILRIDPADPAGPASYSIPGDNPFVGQNGRRGEIWTYGLRNPFRASFAPDGRLVVADVGQSDLEEVNVGTLKGRNMGWPICEGNSCWEEVGPPPNYQAPIYSYPTHDSGRCAIIGGYVARDSGLGSLTGRYLFGDFCGGTLDSLDLDTPGGDRRAVGLSVPDGMLVSFGEDSRGCVYAVTDQTVYRIAGTTATGGCPIAPPPTRYFFSLKQRQMLRQQIPLRLKCSLACTVNVKGSVKVRGRSVAALGRGQWRLSAARTITVRVEIPRRRMKLLWSSLRNGRRVTLTVRVTAVGDDGSPVNRTLTSRLVRPRSH